MNNDTYTALFNQCTRELLKYGRRLAYKGIDLPHIIDLYSTGVYINKCIDCLTDMGRPRQLCGHTECYNGPFQVDDNHYEYCETMDEVLNKYVYLLKLVSEYVIDEEGEVQLKYLKPLES